MALKILDKKQIRYHHCRILSKYKMLSFANFIDFHYVKLMFKCLNGLAPLPFCKYIMTLQSCNRSTRAASSGNCKVPFCKTSFAQTAFSVKGAKSWNALPDHLKFAANFTTFKRATKSCLIQRQTCTHV